MSTELRGGSELGDVAGAATDVEAMAPLAAELRQPAQDWFVAERRAVQALHEGRLADAEKLSGEALSIGKGALSWSARVCNVLQMVVLRRLQGVAEMEEAAREAAEDVRVELPGLRVRLHSRAGRVGSGGRSARRTRDAAPQAFSALDFDETWLGSIAFLAEAAYALGEAEHAQTLYGLLFPMPTAWRSARRRWLWRACRAISACLPPSRDGRSSPRSISRRRWPSTRGSARGRLPPSRWSTTPRSAGDRGLAARAVEACAELGMDLVAERAAALLR